MEEYTIFFGFHQRFLLRLHKEQSSLLLKSPVVDLNNIFGCFLKPVNSVGYFNVRSHYRLSYGGIYSKTPVWVYALCWHLPIFPGRHQPSIFGTTELNFCVRYGNRWTLSVINTNYSFVFKSLSAFLPFGDSCGNRTRVAGVRGRSLNRLTNEPCLSSQRLMVFALISPCNFSWCTIRGSNPGHPD